MSFHILGFILNLGIIQHILLRLKLRLVDQVARLQARNCLLENATNRTTPIVVLKASTTPLLSAHQRCPATPRLFSPSTDFKWADGGGPSDKQYHSDDTPVVALSTGWFNKKHRCFHNITISGNGRSVMAMEVDECNSTMGVVAMVADECNSTMGGCDGVHDYQPPCSNNIVDALKAVWEGLWATTNNIVDALKAVWEGLWAFVAMTGGGWILPGLKSILNKIDTFWD